jgi:hypothetical protein
MHTFFIIAVITGSVVLFAVGVLSVLNDLLARFSQPLSLTLEGPEDNDHDADRDSVSPPWGANDARL